MPITLLDFIVLAVLPALRPAGDDPVVSCAEILSIHGRARRHSPLLHIQEAASDREDYIASDTLATIAVVAGIFHPS